ncbi:MAG: molybdenum cofactor biosynthesis protein MoaE [Rhodothermales bacterium]
MTNERIDTADCRRALEAASAGGFVAFEGWVRDHNEGRGVVSLEYEAYTALAEKEGLLIVTEAGQRFEAERVGAAHRTGHLAVGDLAVWVGVSAAHRDAAFAACRYVIDELKRRVPIWKREHYADGTAEWVNGAARPPEQRTN